METCADDVASPAAALRERWRRSSVRAVWSFPDDWDDPAVDDVVQQMTAPGLAVPGGPAGPVGGDLTSGVLVRACESLGLARARTGCGIREAIDDLACLFALLGAPLPPDALGALCTGWADGQLALPVQMLCIDAESGLSTPEYFGMRLRETYGAAASRRVGLEESHTLVVIDLELEELGGLQRIGRSAAAGSSITATFGQGCPAAALGGGQFVVLAELDAELDGRLAELAVRIARAAAALGVAHGTRHPPRIRTRPLPATHERAVALLAELGRPVPGRSDEDRPTGTSGA